MSLIAVVRVRSGPRSSEAVQDTLRMLGVPVVNSCTVVNDTPTFKGMIAKAPGILTWGIVDDEFLAMLRKHSKDEKATSFRLQPPKRGYGRKGVKVPFIRGGALGDRGDKIKDLITRMVY